jgi:hypothetical protein
MTSKWVRMVAARREYRVDWILHIRADIRPFLKR